MLGVTVQLSFTAHRPASRIMMLSAWFALRSTTSFCGSGAVGSTRSIHPPSRRYHTVARTQSLTTMIGPPEATPVTKLGSPCWVYETSLRLEAVVLVRLGWVVM